MQRYNPYIAAFQVAAAVLTSLEAQQYHSLRAQQDIQTIVVVAVQFGAFAFGLGQKARDLYESIKGVIQPVAGEIVDEPATVEVVPEIRLLSPAPVAPSAVPPVEAWLTRQILYPAIINAIALPPIEPPTQPVLVLPSTEEPKPVVKSARTRKPRGAAKASKPKAMTGPETIIGRPKGTSINGVWID